MIKLDILSDPICPWCYIGWTNLARAMEKRPNHPFAIEWHPYQLNPDMARDGMDRHEYLETKFGGRDGAIKAYAPVLQHAEGAGLSLNFDAITRTPNTMDAHRLIHWAGLEERQTPMVLALFKAYFVEGRDIGDKSVLQDLASSVGLDKGLAQTLLQGEADIKDISDRDRHARARGVTGVPCFIIDNQHVVTGAQPPEFWENVIDDITRQLGAET